MVSFGNPSETDLWKRSSKDCFLLYLILMGTTILNISLLLKLTAIFEMFKYRFHRWLARIFSFTTATHTGLICLFNHATMSIVPCTVNITFVLVLGHLRVWHLSPCFLQVLYNLLGRPVRIFRLQLTPLFLTEEDIR